MDAIIIGTGITLLNVILWLTRGMIFGPTESWGVRGVLILTTWTAWASIVVVRKPTARFRLNATLAAGLMAAVSLGLLAIQPNLMYADLIGSRPELVQKGGIQTIPGDISAFLTVVLWACLVALAGAMAFKARPRVSRWFAGGLLGLGLTAHLLVLQIVPFPLIDVFTATTEAIVGLSEGQIGRAHV